jgi:chorismate mutase
MTLDTAIAIAKGLKDALAEEVARARSERQILRSLDAEGILQHVSLRECFNAQAHDIHEELQQELRRVARGLGLNGTTVEHFFSKIPADAGRLSKVLAEIRALAGSLAELDELNKQLAERAQACVKGYLNALTVRPAAYDRRGLTSFGGPTAGVLSTRI